LFELFYASRYFSDALASQRLSTPLLTTVWHSIEAGRVLNYTQWLAALLQWQWRLIPKQRHLPLLLRLKTRILVFFVIGADIRSTLLENSHATFKMQMQSLLGYVHGSVGMVSRIQCV
jgi:hypothetical protein